MAFTGVSAEPSADERLVPSSWGHRTARCHAAVPATWKKIVKPSLNILEDYYYYYGAFIMLTYRFTSVMIMSAF